MIDPSFLFHRKLGSLPFCILVGTLQVLGHEAPGTLLSTDSQAGPCQRVICSHILVTGHRVLPYSQLETVIKT